MDLCPPEVSQTILGFLKGNELDELRLTSKKWKTLIDSGYKVLPLSIISRKMMITGGDICREEENDNNDDNIVTRDPSQYPKRRMIQELTVNFAEGTIEVLKNMVQSSDGPIFVKNLTLNLNKPEIRSYMEQLPNFLSEIFAPVNVYLFPWHFPNFAQNPAYLRFPKAESITMDGGFYGLDEAKESIYDFLCDEHGYPNKTSAYICLKSENMDFLGNFLKNFVYLENRMRPSGTENLVEIRRKDGWKMDLFLGPRVVKVKIYK